MTIPARIASDASSGSSGSIPARTGPDISSILAHVVVTGPYAPDDSHTLDAEACEPRIWNIECNVEPELIEISIEGGEWYLPVIDGKKAIMLVAGPDSGVEGAATVKLGQNRTKVRVWHGGAKYVRPAGTIYCE